jgi:hypothetical protein
MKKIVLLFVSVTVFLLALFPMVGQTNEYYNAYPGVYKAKFVSVTNASKVSLMVSVWDGFPKKLLISLPKIKTPVLHAKSKQCEIALIDEALTFTQKYFEDSKNIEVTDIHMIQTDRNDGISEVSSELGLLSALLKAKGFARAAHIADTQPWC